MRQVTAAIIIENGCVLITRRPPGDPLAGLWEFPGGKIEPGETAEECLARELAEELGMSAEIGGVVARTTYHYDHGSFEMIAMRAIRQSDFDLRVHDRHEWVPLAELERRELAPADVELARQIVASVE